ncbi:MAG: GWxTD domain-containing protein [Ignavibacteria bacterium]|nr:GWxTD domain-containing protein [Ignavibacteria bacterium]
MRRIKIITFLIIILIKTNLLLSQYEGKQTELFQEQYYFIDPLVFYVKDSSKARIDIYVEIPLATLQFKKNQNTQKFDANFDFLVTITNSNNEIVINNNIPETISRTPEEQKSINEESEYRIKTFYLLPDTYKILTTLRDRNNYKEYKIEKVVFVPNFNLEDISMSSIMLLSDFTTDSLGRKIIYPLVTNNVSDLKDIYIFFEIYNNSENTFPISINYKILNEKDLSVKTGSFSYVITPGTNQKIDKLNPYDYTIGNYKLQLYSNVYPTLSSEKDFTYRWTELPMTIDDLDKAINQMIYIATNDELSYIRNAPSQAEKERRFLEFWKSKDPNPKSPKNEVMIEYYNRVKIANEKFSNYAVEGYRTDMGMVYIIYGPPSNVERHPFDDYSRPYEIWEYYDMNKQFIFVDYTGFGDYRLITPIWDKRFKMR